MENKTFTAMAWSPLWQGEDRLIYVFPRFPRYLEERSEWPLPKDLQGDGPRHENRRSGNRLNDSGGARIQEGVESLRVMLTSSSWR